MIFIYGVLLSVIGVVAIRLTAHTDTTKGALITSLVHMLSALVASAAIIDFTEVHQHIFLYVLGIGVGSLVALKAMQISDQVRTLLKLGNLHD